MGKIHTYIFNLNNAPKVWTSGARFWTFNMDWSALPYNKKFKVTFTATVNRNSSLTIDVVYVLGCFGLPLENVFYSIPETTADRYFCALGLIDFNNRGNTTTTTSYVDVDVDYNPPIICNRPFSHTLDIGVLQTTGATTGQIGAGGTFSTNLAVTLYFEEIDE